MASDWLIANLGTVNNIIVKLLMLTESQNFRLDKNGIQTHSTYEAAYCFVSYLNYHCACHLQVHSLSDLKKYKSAFCKKSHNRFYNHFILSKHFKEDGSYFKLSCQIEI